MFSKSRKNGLPRSAFVFSSLEKSWYGIPVLNFLAGTMTQTDGTLTEVQLL